MNELEQEEQWGLGREQLSGMGTTSYQDRVKSIPCSPLIQRLLVIGSTLLLIIDLACLLALVLVIITLICLYCLILGLIIILLFLNHFRFVISSLQDITHIIIDITCKRGLGQILYIFSLRLSFQGLRNETLIRDLNKGLVKG